MKMRFFFKLARRIGGRPSHKERHSMNKFVFKIDSVETFGRAIRELILDVLA